jgi:hypothetical protein
MKGLLSKKPYLNLLSVLYAGLVVFEQAAVLGRARNTQMETLAKLFSTPGDERGACDHLIEATKENIQGYGQTPESFIDFFTKTVGAGAFESYQNPDTFKQLSRKEVQLWMVLNWMEVWFYAGIGLGLAFPESVVRMWRNSYEVDRSGIWERAQQAGAFLDIPKKDAETPLTLEEMEQVVLSQVAEYAREYFPEIVAPLKLP